MIKVHDLAYTYPDADAPVLHGLDFEVGRGEILGFLGPSGAGKSTTQKILIRLLSGYQGSVQLWDTEVSQLDRRAMAQVGVAFEVPRFYTRLTARENLAFFGGLYGTELENPMGLLESVGLGSDADTRVSAFSKGMRTRLNFCRAVQHHPEILFLDEPTSGLDPVLSRTLETLILERRDQGCTVFLTTHNMHVAQNLCDRVAFMVGGRLLALDAPRALNLRHGRRRLAVEHRVDGRVERVEFDLDGLGQNAAFQRILGEGNIETLHTQEATLDDVFHTLTGSRLA